MDFGTPERRQEISIEMKKEKTVVFKNLSFTVAGKKITCAIRITDKGIFTLSVPRTIQDALGCESDIEGPEAKPVEHRISKLVRDYDKLVVKSVYRIKYRIMFSRKVKEQMPSAIMNEEAWSRTARLGSEYVNDKSMTISLYWFPCEIRLRGKEEVCMKLELADEENYYIRGAKEAVEKGKDPEFYMNSIHKPYDGLILVTDNQHWTEDREEEIYRDIPLTKETFEFFSSTEAGFVQMLTKLFAFLNRDEKALMHDISKMIEGNNFLSIENKAK
jgi:hypothetical protein